MKILILNGPNLNLLGKRDPSKYGNQTLDKINNKLRALAAQKDVSLVFFQSNCEGALIDLIQNDTTRNDISGVIINPGALVRYGYSLRQALIDLGKPVMEVHMSDIDKTGISKSVNVLEDIRIGQVKGMKEDSYFVGLQKLIEHIRLKGQK
ncbi:type II 3-dehydroquinate dehydratase [Patescibacteria group bacterium]|nr:type II 3-dehydroquinate dehydratase [Patescibacteria group bacterium]MCL5797614.1 type II 3-dehydroquinate dehydratase [Patescibacteria group bacterium]